MSISTDYPGTRQDLSIWLDSDTILTGTIRDADGVAVDLTGCALKLLIKASASDADGAAIAAGEVTVLVAENGTIRMEIDRSLLAANVSYYYDLKVAFPVDYATAWLQGDQFIALYGSIPALQEITRDATA